MNRLSLSYLLILVLSVLYGCSEKEEPDLITISDDSIQYFNNIIEFPSSGGIKTVKFSTNKNWEITVSESDMDEDWCKVSPKSGVAGDVTLTISVDENTAFEERSVMFTLHVGEITKNLLISQKQNETLILSTPSNNILSYKEQTFEIKLLTNAKFEISCDSKWIDYNATKGISESSIFLSVHKNNTHENRSCKVIIRSDSLEQVIEISQYGQPTDLSANGTANSYIVPLRDAYFCFDASVAGNDRSYLLKGGSKANIVWESSNNSLLFNHIDSVEYDSEEGRIIFHAKQSEGNVLIALLDNYDNIIWSWHLWLTDYNPEDDFITFSDGTILMDRYLGASSEEGIGLYYQYGRKDPFDPDHCESFTPIEEPLTVEYCTSHPNIFIKAGNPMTDWDWNSEHTAIWSTTKTIYDPCPPGWKVMDETCLSSFSEDCFVDKNSHCFIIGEPNCTPQTKFRTTGFMMGKYVQSSSKDISMWTNRGFYFYNDIYTAIEKFLSIEGDDTNFKNSNIGRAYGFCIRCQRENTHSQP